MKQCCENYYSHDYFHNLKTNRLFFEIEVKQARINNEVYLRSILYIIIHQKLFFIYTRTWSQCDSVQDFLSVYDGRTTAFPELARICGGDYLPDIISSGPDMLIEFQTSPYDSLYHPTPISFLLGFEMQIQVNII